MSNDFNNENVNLEAQQEIQQKSQPEKKKQKPGLNAVRPDDYTEQKFKTMAKERNLSQTEFFERIFWAYLKKDNQEKRNEALNCDGEINLIAKNLDNILINFKSIVDKAQDKIVSVKANAEQTIENLKLDLDTLQKKNEALEKRNAELENINLTYTETKAGLEKTITNLNNEIQKKDEEIIALKESNQEKDKTIKYFEKQAALNEKEINSLKMENYKLKEENQSKSIRIQNLEVTCSGLQSSVERMETLKKAEIEAIEAKYKATIFELQNKLSTISESVRSEMESEKKLALAELKLELAQTKEKLAELLLSNRDTDVAHENDDKNDR